MKPLVIGQIYPILDAIQLSVHYAQGISLTEMVQIAEHLEHCPAVTLVQLRCKAEPRQQYQFLQQWIILLRKHAPRLCLIVNDRVDMAMALDADGVHVGQNDLPIQVCRTLLGSHRLLGISTHTLQDVAQAAQTSADYIGFGPLFTTHSKPDALPARGLDLLRQVRARAPSMPIVAIGGIGMEQLADVLRAGAASVAMINGLFTENGLLGHLLATKNG